MKDKYDGGAPRMRILAVLRDNKKVTITQFSQPGSEFYLSISGTDATAALNDMAHPYEGALVVRSKSEPVQWSITKAGREFLIANRVRLQKEAEKRDSASKFEAVQELSADIDERRQAVEVDEDTADVETVLQKMAALSRKRNWIGVFVEIHHKDGSIVLKTAGRINVQKSKSILTKLATKPRA